MNRWLFLLLTVAAACGVEEPKPAVTAPPIMSADWLRAHRDAVVLVDMQTDRETYEKGHIPGAAYAFYEDFRTDDKKLASADELARALGALGIDEDTHVVIYDEKHGRNAGYLWYALRQLGHGAVSILDGHMDAFKNELVTGPPPAVEPKTYRPRRKPEVVTGEWVKENLGEVTILDARPTGQYTAEEPKKGMKGGHIPGALSVPWNVFTGPDGLYLDDEAARAALFARTGRELAPDEEIVLYCNSYHQAAHLQFVLSRLGFTNLRPYDASMREWEKMDWPRTTGEKP